MTWGSGASTIARTSETPPDRSAERAAVSEFAEQFVLTWLGTTEDNTSRLDRFVALSSATQWPEKPSTGTAAEVAGLSRRGTGPWSVTVGVTVNRPNAQPTRRYFQVPVTYTGGELVAVTLPSAVAAPAAGEPPKLDYQYTLPSYGRAIETVSQFLSSLLAGAGDLSRVVTPGVQVRAVTPAPYRAVEVAEAAADTDLSGTEGTAPRDGDRVRVLATAAATWGDTETTTVQYALTLR
ncbi:MAG: conjugal transfer protein, partial [Nocardioidaceae bacterium]